MNNPGASARHRRVLVVDDNDVLRVLLSRVLEWEGYDVVSVTDGHAAFEAAQGDVDLVVLDVGLPDMSGLEVCRRLRADPATESLPVILLTGRDHRDDQRDGFRAGADEFLVKPVEIQDLVAAVDRVAAHRLPASDAPGNRPP